MANESEGDNGKILRMRLLTWMQDDLDAQADDDLALRKALLAAVFVASTKEDYPRLHAYYRETRQFGHEMIHRMKTGGVRPTLLN